MCSVGACDAFADLRLPDRPEAYDKADVDPASGRPLDVGVSGLEGKGSASKSDGMLKKGLLAATESEHRGAGSAPEVKVVGNGHCHSE